MAERLDTPKENRRSLIPRIQVERDTFGKIAEGIARFMGTPQFLVYMTAFCIAWLSWNTFGPEGLRFDSKVFGFTLLTLMLSLQASYSAPLILLAQNRQTDRDRVAAEQDRQSAERNLADTEYVAREMAALRIALGDVATRDFVRSEIRNLLEEILAESDNRGDGGKRRDDRGRRDSRGRKEDRKRSGSAAAKTKDVTPADDAEVAPVTDPTPAPDDAAQPDSTPAT
ncbi:DUF1003 domain-containing protein [Pengzhenrongella frigida]|uniref:DUF1003 domain-containing protein n=1 Tax=Pengzhenrongella frigida TaxID=1259133 RepID=A0A4Q5N2A3_9MICO|nr:DUF1003 domain-containing protein [Cellulomonas sp. HLT2-17]RYV52259.1 DUF1003 domain-containing protein [Cellulomonas sp. HLT2-17]